MPAISVTKKIRHIPNPIFAKDAITQVEAIDLIKIEGTPLVAEEEIEIFKNINVFRVASLHRDFLGVSGELYQNINLLIFFNHHCFLSIFGRNYGKSLQ